MLEPATPKNEALRLRALRALDILDTAAEERFDRYTRLAQYILETPIVLISLIDGNRQWFKSRQGLDATETARDISFCGHAILGDELFCVPDATADPRFSDNPLVTEEPDIRFYVGAPLVLTGGEHVGTLCAIDRVPRHLTSEQRAALADLARCVVDELEVRRTQAALADRDEQLLKSSEQVRSIIDTVVDGIVTIDAKGQILTVNPAAKRLFGFSAAEMVGQNVKMLMPEPFQSAHDGYLHNYLSSGEKKIIGTGREVVGQRKNGTTFPMDLSVGEMSVKGESMFTGIVRDITERKRMEQLKNEFISTVSHELRTPLTSIKGSLGLIRSGVTGELPEKLGTMLDIAYNNSDRLVRLINDILDIEKIEAGKMDFKMVRLDLLTLIQESLDANSAFARGYSVTYHFHTTLDAAAVVGDHDRLMQAMTNLLSNAAKFSPEGSCVEIRLMRLEDRFRIEVCDQGPGIPADFHDQIFTKFSQADSSNTRQKGGTGLGLNITQAIVARLGGQIGFDSEEGVGSCFYIELPDLDPESSDERILDGTSHIVTGTILVCEQNPVVAKEIDNILSNAGFLVDWAMTAAQAQMKLNQQDYAAMTLDLQQQQDEGLSLLRQLSQQERNADIPVILISAQADTDRSTDEPISPVESQKLVVTLRTALLQQSSTKHRILHIEDDADICRLVSLLLDSSIDVTEASTFTEAQEWLGNAVFDLIILDLMLPDGSGEQLLHQLPSTRNAHTPVVIFSARELLINKTAAVQSALLKSKTDNDQLLNSLLGALRPRASNAASILNPVARPSTIKSRES